MREILSSEVIQDVFNRFRIDELDIEVLFVDEIKKSGGVNYSGTFTYDDEFQKFKISIVRNRNFIELEITLQHECLHIRDLMDFTKVYTIKNKKELHEHKYYIGFYAWHEFRGNILTLEQRLLNGILPQKTYSELIIEMLNLLKISAINDTNEDFLYTLMVFNSYYCYVRQKNHKYNIIEDDNALMVFDKNDCILFNNLADFMIDNYNCDLLGDKYEQFQLLIRDILFD